MEKYKFLPMRHKTSFTSLLPCSESDELLSTSSEGVVGLSSVRTRRQQLIDAHSEENSKMASFDMDAQLRIEETAEKTPVFSYSTADFNWKLTPAGPSYVPGNKFEKVMQQRYDSAKRDGAFNYELNILYKLLPGRYNLVCQLNFDRGQLRRKPHPNRFMGQPFDHRRFNFTKIKQKEILLDLRCADSPVTSDSLDRHLLIVNVSPVERAHCLAVPCIQRCLPQVLTGAALKLGIHLMLLSGSANFYVVYNSLLALASVNHLHMHTVFWPYVCDITKLRPDQVSEGLHVFRPPDWFVHTLVFQLKGPEDVDRFAGSVLKTTNYLKEKEVPHNLVMCRAPSIWDPEDKHLYVTTYIYPRKHAYGAKPPTNFNAAAFELTGMLLVYTLRFFQSATEESCLRIIEDEARISNEQFDEIFAGLQTVLSKNEK